MLGFCFRNFVRLLWKVTKNYVVLSLVADAVATVFIPSRGTPLAGESENYMFLNTSW
jgi:hypothetical protein